MTIIVPSRNAIELETTENDSVCITEYDATGYGENQRVHINFQDLPAVIAALQAIVDREK